MAKNLIEAADRFGGGVIEDEPVGMDRLLENLESATLFLRWVHRNADPGALRDEAGEHYRTLRELREELPQRPVMLWIARAGGPSPVA